VFLIYQYIGSIKLKNNFVSEFPPPDAKLLESAYQSTLQSLTYLGNQLAETNQELTELTAKYQQLKSNKK